MDYRKKNSLFDVKKGGAAKKNDNKEEIIKSQLEDAINQKDILEKRIIKYETEKNEYLEQLKKLD